MTKKEAFDNLVARVQDLEKAIIQLQTVADTETVGLLEWCEHNGNVLFEIDEELFGDE